MDTQKCHFEWHPCGLSAETDEFCQTWNFVAVSTKTETRLPTQFIINVGKRNIAKSTTDPRVEFLSQVQTQILIKFQNFDQASTSKSQPNTSLFIKLKPQNLDQISTKIQLLQNIRRKKLAKL